jgi:hypothetical protein
MKKICKFFLKLIKIAVLIYGALFAVFYFDLDGKFLYYIWEPLMVKHYDNMKRADTIGMPYDQKSSLMPDEYSEIN